MQRAIFRTVVAVLGPLASVTACSVLHPLDGFAGAPETEDSGPAIATTTPTSTATTNPPDAHDSGTALDAGQADVVDAAPTVIDAGVDASVVETQHYLYAIGGSFTEDLFQDNIYYAPILADGSIGDWDVTTPLSTGTRNHATVVHGDDVYIIGGEYSGGMLSADVHVSTFLPSGKLGPWKDFVGVLGTRRKDHAAALVGDSLYVGGGGVSDVDPPGPLKPIQRATLSSMSVGAFATVSNYPDGSRLHAMASFGSTLFSIGGYTNGTYVADVFGFSVGAGGALGALTKLTPLPVPTAYDRAVVVGSTVYIVGGISSTQNTMSSAVYSATVQTNGTVSAWTRQNDFATGRWRHATVAAYGSIYMAGGRVGQTGGFLADVQIARILPDNSLEWRTSTKPLPKPLASHVLVVH